METFKKYYSKVNGCEFMPSANDGEAGQLAQALLDYFNYQDDFLNGPLLASAPKPSLDKGLIIVGMYGCSKTSSMRAICSMIKDQVLPETEKKAHWDHPLTQRKRLRFTTANAVVKKYEGLVSQSDKHRFWEVMTKQPFYFDDVLTERQASNYGRIELFKDILEERSQSGALTVMSCNYHPSHPKELQQALNQFNEKYGPRVYDRLFDYNVIQLSGKSLRS